MRVEFQKTKCKRVPANLISRRVLALDFSSTPSTYSQHLIRTANKIGVDSPNFAESLEQYGTVPRAETVLLEFISTQVAA